MLSGVIWCNLGDLKGDASHFYQHDLLSLAIFQTTILLYYFTIILTHCLRVREITLKSVSSCARDPTHFLPVNLLHGFGSLETKTLKLLFGVISISCYAILLSLIEL